jgi:hypothetical protein
VQIPEVEHLSPPSPEVLLRFVIAITIHTNPFVNEFATVSLRGATCFPKISFCNADCDIGVRDITVR